MTDRDPPAPDAPPPARIRGAPRVGGAVSRTENVRVTAPDLQRRAQLEKTRGRLVLATGGFGLLFAALAVRLTAATVLFPHEPPASRIVDQVTELVEHEHDRTSPDAPKTMLRAAIQDRNGELLAVSLPTAGVYADPKEMIDIAEVAHKLKQVLPRLDEDVVRARLGSAKSFVYLARQVTPREQLAINDLGIPGIYFQQTDRRHYPLGRLAAQVLGGVDIDQHGVAGAERAFDARLRTDPQPLRLSIDARVEAIVHDELSNAMQEFSAIGACGIVMDVNTGEVLAMVSLPDYDANLFGRAAPDDRFNRALTGMYEPGSTFKLQTAAMALDSGAVHIWDQFDAAHPIHIGRFTITDFEGKHRFLYLPEVLAYSSNLGAAHIALDVGGERQRAWLRQMGMFDRIGIELPEAGKPLAPPVSNWGEAATMTVGFGHGIAVSPLHVVRGTATLANGGVFRAPTILAVPPGAAPAEGARIMETSTSDTIRKLMRLVVTAGYGKSAEVPGYYVGGKTGTAEKVAAGGGYKKHTNVSAFISVFPMNAPRYAVYMMVDEPHATAATHGYSTASYVAAPFAGHVIARIAPMLGLFPQLENAAAIEASLSIPLQPGKPPGFHGEPPTKGPAANAPPANAPLANAPVASNPVPVEPAAQSVIAAPRGGRPAPRVQPVHAPMPRLPNLPTTPVKLDPPFHVTGPRQQTALPPASTFAAAEPGRGIGTSPSGQTPAFVALAGDDRFAGQ
jgi:cell division protein FtsI (penicillin-binding protein 3)